jgi:hypothetical protein
LESEYGSFWCGHLWAHGNDVETQRRPGTKDKISRAREILSQSVVRIPLKVYGPDAVLIVALQLEQASHRAREEPKGRIIEQALMEGNVHIQES